MAADRRELAAFESLGWGLRPTGLDLRWSARATHGDTEVLFAANGPGRDNALRALHRVDQHAAVGAIVSTGFAGGLSPDLCVGDVFLAQSVLEFRTGVEYSVRLPECANTAPSGCLLTVDYVVQDSAAKADLHKRGAHAVDMEAAALAGFAQSRQMPFYCIRAISDDARTSFDVDFNRARRPDGTFSGWRIAAQAGFSRRRWRCVMDLKRAGEQASQNLAAFFQHCRFTF